MLEKDTIQVKGKAEFDRNVKDLFVNMTGNIRTLHKTNYKSCQYSKMSNSFITFSTEEEVEVYEKNNKNATPFRKCGICFKNKK